MLGLHYLYNACRNSLITQYNTTILSTLSTLANEYKNWSIFILPITNQPLICCSLAAGQSQPYVSSIPPLFRRGETPLYIPSLPPAVPDVDRYPSSEIHLPRKPSDMFDPSARYRLKARSHSARMSRYHHSNFLFHVIINSFRFSSASRLADRQKQFAESRTRSGEKSEFESFEFDPSEIYRMIEERGWVWRNKDIPQCYNHQQNILAAKLFCHNKYPRLEKVQGKFSIVLIYFFCIGWLWYIIYLVAIAWSIALMSQIDK